MSPGQLRQEWALKFKPLIGRTIKQVSYLIPVEQEQLGWQRSSLVIQLDDDTLLFASADDEGNDAGALFISHGNKTKTMPEVAPVI